MGHPHEPLGPVLVLRIFMAALWLAYSQPGAETSSVSTCHSHLHILASRHGMPWSRAFADGHLCSTYWASIAFMGRVCEIPSGLHARRRLRGLCIWRRLRDWPGERTSLVDCLYTYLAGSLAAVVAPSSWACSNFGLASAVGCCYEISPYTPFPVLA